MWCWNRYVDTSFDRTLKMGSVCSTPANVARSPVDAERDLSNVDEASLHEGKCLSMYLKRGDNQAFRFPLDFFRELKIHLKFECEKGDLWPPTNVRTPCCLTWCLPPPSLKVVQVFAIRFCLSKTLRQFLKYHVLFKEQTRFGFKLVVNITAIGYLGVWKDALWPPG